MFTFFGFRYLSSLRIFASVCNITILYCTCVVGRDGFIVCL